jgi:hypothetical protein
MYRIARFMLITSGLCLSPLALANTVPTTTSPGETATTATVPAPDSPKAIQDLHALLIKAYRAGEASASQGGMPQLPALPTPQAAVPAAHRPVLDAWVEVLQNAIDTLSSAAFIAAWGFALGMVMIGIAALLLAVNLRRRPR